MATDGKYTVLLACGILKKTKIYCEIKAIEDDNKTTVVAIERLWKTFLPGMTAPASHTISFRPSSFELYTYA